MDEKLLREIVERLVSIETRLEDIIHVKIDVEELKKDVVRLEEKDKSQEEKINELMDSNKWLTRCIAAAVITSIIGLIVAVIKLGLGVG